MARIGLFNYKGCGGCNLSIMDLKPKLLKFMNIVKFVDSDGALEKDIDIGILVGECTKEEMEYSRSKCGYLVMAGQCANKSLDTAVEDGVSTEGVHRVFGCPIVGGELITVIHSLIKGIPPKQKNFPVCIECKANENICLFKNNIVCKGSVTLGGCDAKCPTKGTACRGCRGNIKNARLDVFDKIAANTNP